MTLLLGILTFFGILAVLILVHELGHFSFAKLFGVRVDEFGLGFPPRLKGWRRGTTIYSLNALPLGGFVKMAGENGEDTEPDSFGAKPPWQRFVILAAGPAMNLILAVGILFVAYVLGSPRGLTVITGVSPSSPAAAAGLRTGDTVVSLDGQHVTYFDQFQTLVIAHRGHLVTLGIDRNGRLLTVKLVPRVNPPANQGSIGLELRKTATVSYAPGQALSQSFQDIGLMVASLPEAVQQLANPSHGQVAGPIGIAHITTDVVRNEPSGGPGTLFQLMALLSANLGVLNLLPIPALDGGRLVFVLLSWVRRRNLDPQLEGLIHMAGMAALLMLIALVSYHDVVRWVSGGSY